MAAAHPHASCAIAVMAKAPRAGNVKTRLVPPLTADAAALLSASFLRDVTENVRLAATWENSIESYVAYAPAGDEALFDGKLAEGTRFVLADGGIDVPEGVEGFGRCLLHATQALFLAGYGSVCLLNSDSPNLPTAFLAEAARLLALAGERVVLGPAEDGGYYLIGMNAPCAHLFMDIVWSTDRVAEQTRGRARELGLELIELPLWYDVDDFAALRRFIEGCATPPDGPALPYAAPATQACMKRLRLSEILEMTAKA